MATRIVKRTMTSAVGNFFLLMDDWIASGTGWSLYDDLSATSKVYLCDGGATPFYLRMDDNTNYASEFKLSTGWSLATHAYTGYQGTNISWYRAAIEARIVGDETAIHMDYSNLPGRPSIYIGYVNPVDAFDTKAILITGYAYSNTAGSAFNKAYANNYWLYGKVGGNGNILYVSNHTLSQHSYNGPVGKLYLENMRLCEGDTAKRLRAYPKFIYAMSPVLPVGFAAKDTIRVDGVTYQICSDSSNVNFYLAQITID